MSTVLDTREPSAQYLEAAPPSLVRQFELLAKAPGGVLRLRELILVLAVQGKLTRRDTLTEPASVLLAQILKLKASLVDAGKIKRDKPLPAIDEADPPFDIPQSWCWIRLGSVTNYGSPSKGGSIGPETWVLDLEDIEKSTGRLLRRVRRSERPALSEKNSFQAGDVLYGKLRPYLNKVIVADEPGVCTTELVPFRCYGDWVPQYFKIALSSPAFLEYVNARSYGMKMPRLGTEDARMGLLPLPPLEEQARIVARVEELMRLCDELEAKGRLEAQQHARLLETLLGTLTDSTTAEELAANWQRVAEHFDLLLDRPEAVDELEQTVLQLAVRGLLVPQDSNDESADELLTRIQEHKDRLVAEGKIRAAKPLDEIAEDERPFSLPPTWAWARFGDVTINRDGERVPVSSSDRERRGKVYDYYGASGVIDKIDGFLFDKTLLLIGEDGANLINRSTPIAFLAHGKYWVNNHAHVIDAMDLGLLRYLELFVNAISLEPYVTGTAQPKMNQAKLNSIVVALPPLAEQSRIVARVTELRRLCADLRQRLADSQSTQSRLAEALVAAEG